MIGNISTYPSHPVHGEDPEPDGDTKEHETEYTKTDVVHAQLWQACLRCDGGEVPHLH